MYVYGSEYFFCVCLGHPGAGQFWTLGQPLVKNLVNYGKEMLRTSTKFQVSKLSSSAEEDLKYI